MEFPLKEREIQSVVAELYRSVGAAVYSTSVYRPGGAKTLQGGIPDLIVLLPRRLGVLFHETKTAHGKQSDAQVIFESRCQQAGVAYVCGGVAEAQSALELAGLLRDR